MKLIRLKSKGHMLEVSKKEALAIISSLASQVSEDSPNHGRLESKNSETGKYFSIAVIKENK